MKLIKLSVLLTVISLMISCSGNGNTSEGKPGQTVTDAGVVTGKAIQMTKADFISKVFDYENNTVWKYQGDVPSIVDFYADWCKPCKIISPYLEEIAATYAGKINVYKVNVDQEKELAGAFQVQSIPAVLFIPMNGQPQLSVGAMAKEEYMKVVKDILLEGKAE